MYGRSMIRAALSTTIISTNATVLSLDALDTEAGWGWWTTMETLQDLPTDAEWERFFLARASMMY